MNKIIFIISFVSFFQINLWGQNADQKILPFNDFIKMVQEHHPMAAQAEIMEESGVVGIQIAKGAFDPKAFTDIDQKYFEGDQYYSLINGGVQIPTWLGLDFYAGYEQNGGTYLNPMNLTPNSGLAYAGASIPIGKGLFIDRRRADLKNAKIFSEITAVERKLMLNDLLLEASRVYWDWFNAYNTMLIYEEAEKLAQQRFNAVKQSALIEEIPTIDTVEAGIQLQNRQLNLQEARLKFKNTSAWLSVYLWADGWVPLEINDQLVPPEVKNMATNGVELIQKDSINKLVENHPEIVKAGLNIDRLNIERKLKVEMLKPSLNLKYNAINEPINNNPFSEYSVNNYTWGLTFNMPLFLRKERGELKLTNLKIQDETLTLTTKKAAVNQKINMAFNSWQTSLQQIELYQQTVRDYLTLLNGERNLFYTGESSLFMVNSRELGYINAQVKLIQLYKENQMSAVKTLYEMGILSD